MQKPKVWAIGGGKGGVGKSMISANLGISLAQKGEKTVLIDGDLGGANLHTCLGIANPKVGLSDYISRQFPNLEDVVIPTTVANLGMISGATDSISISNPKHGQKVRFLKAVHNMDATNVVLDLGAGSNFNTLDFFLTASPQVIVVIPEPTSIENAYRFIKSAFYRQVRQNSPNSKIRDMVDETMEKNNRFGIRTPGELLKHFKGMSEDLSQFVDEQILSFRPQLILNQVRTEKDIKIGFAMGNACKKYFGIQLDFAGYIHFDDLVWKSIIQRQALLNQHADNIVCSEIRHLADNLKSGKVLARPT